MSQKLQSKERRWQFRIQATLLLVVLCLPLLGWFAVQMQRAKDRQARTDQQTKVLKKISHLAPYPDCPSETGDFEELMLNSPANGGQIGKELAVLKNLPSLRWLSLARTRVTNSSLAHLEAVPSLRILELNDANISDEGLAHVGKIEGLKKLYLVRTQITDAGLLYLTDMTTLEWIFLDGTAVSDEGVRCLADLPNLCYLSLAGTQVTNDVLTTLQAMPSLEIVCLEGSEVTKEGVEAIEKAVPDVTVIWSLPVDPTRRPHYRSTLGR